MTSDESLKLYGLPAQPQHRDEIRRLLSDELEKEKREEGDQELLRLFCAQIFSIGVADDCLVVWDAKNCNFDTMCGIDVQFLCGAGLQRTKEFLASSLVPSAKDAFAYLSKCEQSGDFAGFSHEQCIADARFYYGLDPSRDDPKKRLARVRNEWSGIGSIVDESLTPKVTRKSNPVATFGNFPEHSGRERVVSETCAQQLRMTAEDSDGFGRMPGRN